MLLLPPPLDGASVAPYAQGYSCCCSSYDAVGTRRKSLFISLVDPLQPPLLPTISSLSVVYCVVQWWWAWLSRRRRTDTQYVSRNLNKKVRNYTASKTMNWRFKISLVWNPSNLAFYPGKTPQNMLNWSLRGLSMRPVRNAPQKLERPLVLF